MRVFVTGSTGYVGSTVVRALVEAGHEVGGLVHDRSKEGMLRERGAVPIIGNLRDPETYQHFAAESQAVIHCAFESPEIDRQAVEELVSALKAEGGEKSFIYTSGVWVLGNTTQAADEDTPVNPAPIVAWRPPVEQMVLAAATDALATAVVRPGLVYGGRGGIFSGWLKPAMAGEPVTYIGEGKNRIPPVHKHDLARLYLLIAEKRARGIFHGVDDSSPTVEAAAKAVGTAAGNGGKTAGWPVEQARAKVGSFADAMVLDQVVVAKRSRELGWKPTRVPMVENGKEIITEFKG